MQETSSSGNAATLDVARRFLGADTTLEILGFGNGLINKTFRVDTPEGSYVLQRINPAVFPRPERIMGNIARLQAAAARHRELAVRLPRLTYLPDGSAYARDADGGIWRLMERIHPSRVLREIENPLQALEVGRTLGRFHRLAALLEADAFEITLPGFHHTPDYLAALDDIVRAGGAGVEEAAPELGFVEQRRDLATALTDAVERGLTAPRVIHGDPKIDNLLFDVHSDRALCLIDLDTVQPGLVHHDIGDSLRSCCNRLGESAGNAPAVTFDLNLCEAIVNAYAQEAGGLLDANEIALLYPAIRLIPFELGIRFLADHLQGDRYFAVTERGQNLRKARIQFALVADIERKQAMIRRVVDCSFNHARRP
ncbi:MAG: aminoglycoside phosphotransferase family protein [Thiohalocapsa sp.]|nr:aminoglycoside phosphotransferase family protein [Thiohalocapsa sp.]